MIWLCGNVVCDKSSGRFDLEKDGRNIHAFPVRGETPIVDSVENISGLLIGKKFRPSQLTQFLSFRHYCDIALWKCGSWEKFQKIRFGRDGRNIHAFCGTRIDADSWFRWKYSRFVDRKKIRTVGIDPILKFQTLCDIALWKCGLWEKFQKIRFGKRWKQYPCVSGPRRDADSWFRWKYFRSADRKKIQTIAIDPIFKFQTLLDIALWKCGLWEKFQKIRFGRDGRNIYAFPVRG